MSMLGSAKLASYSEAPEKRLSAPCIFLSRWQSFCHADACFALPFKDSFAMHSLALCSISKFPALIILFVYLWKNSFPAQDAQVCIFLRSVFPPFLGFFCSQGFAIAVSPKYSTSFFANGDACFLSNPFPTK